MFRRTCNGSTKYLMRKQRAIFDYDAVPAVEENVGEMVINTKEALLIQQIVNALVHGGLKKTRLGLCRFTVLSYQY